MLLEACAKALVALASTGNFHHVQPRNNAKIYIYDRSTEKATGIP